MTDIEKKAREYAQLNFAVGFEDIPGIMLDISDNLKRAFLAGAAYALSNQWRDAEKEKPDLEEYDCLCRCKIAGIWQFRVLRWYDVDQEWRDHKGLVANVSRWLPIPDYKPKGE